ncbi:extracellular solute-binding protein [Paenibacillus sp. N4]|uniref:extracellular solute-binding protein n=1 Tax=Paenibacillus vietnamensis TaxID=2590547 RepID=UPI001CD1862A|nr:extracellular solute-binding protein [Paenibacillus vietnamensis]MCA0755173.1 extracellular solute-binding protein [Paenibacillus vietnamensis]
MIKNGIFYTVMFTLLVGVLGGAAVWSYSEEKAPPAAVYKLEDAKRPASGLILQAGSMAGEAELAAVLPEWKGRQQVAEWMEGEALEWTVNAAESGDYELAAGYFPLEGNGQPIEFMLYVDDKAITDPYAPLELNRLFYDEPGPLRTSGGNELRPKQLEAEVWLHTTVAEAGELADGPLKLKLAKGEHRIRLENVRGTAAVDYVQLIKSEKPAAYADYKAANDGKRTADSQKTFITVQAEHAFAKSASGLFPTTDRSSPLTTPYSPTKLRINTVGGSNWELPGQWISYKLEVPEAGWYKIGARYHQNEVKGSFVSRKIWLDGKVPFAELNAVRFPYEQKWSVTELGEETGEPYLFYLEKGEHELKLEVTLGEMAQAVQNVQQMVYDLNQIYRKIVMITGVNPDVYRDYEIEKSIPGLLEQFRSIADGMRGQAQQLDEMSGQANAGSRTLNLLALQLEGFIDRPDQIPKRLENYKTNITALADWMLGVKKQPLELDYIYLASPEQKKPRGEAGIFAQGLHEIRAFAGSFLQNYDSMEGSSEADRSIQVWTGLGRDQAFVLKRLIDESFIPETGISVNLNLVGTSLVTAVMAGEGPDVNLFTSRGDAMNLAIRGALVPLDGQDGFTEVKQDYMDSAFVPYQYQGKTYAIPDDQEFFMLFYRKDILQELGLTPPQTWEELLRIAPVLQNNNMQIGLPYENLDAFQLLTKGIGSLNLFPTLLMQHESGIYNEAQDATRFDEPQAYNAFKQWTDFYNLYDYPLYKDDFNRFRTGEMPIVVSTYKLYTRLAAAAPEITGTWDMIPIPGIKQGDGQVNRSTGATGTAGIILKDAVNVEDAWTFMKWFNRADIQSQFTNELENEMGILGRRVPANLVSFEASNWSRAEQASLSAQWEQVYEIPELPGGYYTSRNIDNAFREVVFQMGNARESLFYWNKDINDEIKRKRYEFGVEP